MARFFSVLLPTVWALYVPFCPAPVRPTVQPSAAQMEELWQRPVDLAERDLFVGPWSADHAPDPRAPYRLVERKHSGVNPGMTVDDPKGRRWSVKQPGPDDASPEGPIEVFLSRVLSAIGYHQPPVYFLPAFTLVDDWGSHTEPGGRFRLKEKTLKERGEWSWQQNPFVGTRPYQGLLAVLMLFGSSDIKNDNNSLYELRTPRGLQKRYVVRDLGMALGETGRFAPRRGDPDLFARQRFIRSTRDGFVDFDYHGWHQELVERRITTDDVVWASNLLAQLTDRQWRDAFRSGGFDETDASRYLQTIQARIALGQNIGGADRRVVSER